MPYYSSSGLGPGPELNFEYPLRDSEIECTPYEFNITYVMPEIPDDLGNIILTQVAQSNFMVITTYCFPQIKMPKMLHDGFIRFYIQHHEKNHCLAMHKRSDPFSTHRHFGLVARTVTELDQLSSLLYYLFLPVQSFSGSGEKIESVRQFLYAVKYLVNHPEEPGIHFENGHYALRDGYNTDSVYFHGPYKLVTVPESGTVA